MDMAGLPVTPSILYARTEGIVVLALASDASLAGAVSVQLELAN